MFSSLNSIYSSSVVLIYRGFVAMHCAEYHV